MNECEYWYANGGDILGKHIARNNQRDLMNQSSFDHDVYWKALVIAKENMPADHKYYTVHIPKIKSKARICQANELPEIEELPCITMTFIRLYNDNIYLHSIENIN